MQRIVVLNPKGGSGKTTIAINLASYLASRQLKPVLMDLDPQGSSLRWVRKRRSTQPLVQVVAAFENDGRTTRSFQLRVPMSATHVIVDTPAALEAPDAAIGHRHSRLLALHSRSAAGRQGAPRG
jgi:chromosome partitioning protein